MNITQKYNQLINEQITRSQFIEAARKDPSLKQWITSTTSYDDIIRILRNKNIIQEVKIQPKTPKSLLKEAVEDSINYDSPITSRKEIEQSNGLSVGDEVKYIGNESKLQGAENLVISSIIDDGEGNILVNIENIDSGEAVNDVPISDIIKAEFDLSEQNEKVKNTSVDAMRNIATFLQNSGYKSKEDITDILIKLRQGDNETYNKLKNIKNIGSDRPGSIIRDVDAIFGISKNQQNEIKTFHTDNKDKKEIEKIGNQYEKNRKQSNPLGAVYNAKQIANIKTRPKLNEIEVENEPWGNYWDEQEEQHEDWEESEERFIPDEDLDENQNHIDWNNISLADAERLRDHYERTSILPYGLTPELYNNIMQKYDLDSNYSEYSLHERKNPIKGGKGDKLTIDDVNPNELRMGIKVEMEHTKDKDKAIDIALDHLAEHPFYYTQLKMAGLADELKDKPKNKKRIDLPVEVDKKMSNTVDKANGIKPVKGFQNAKASANKASKETVKPAKGVKQEKYTAKKAKGIKQTMPLPGKEKKIKIQETIDIIVKQILQEAISKAYGGWKVVGDPGKIKKKSKTSSTSFQTEETKSCSCGCNSCEEATGELNEDHIHSRKEQEEFIIKNKEITRKDITPEWLAIKSDEQVKSLYDLIEKTIKNRGQKKDIFQLNKDNPKAGGDLGKLNELEVNNPNKPFKIIGNDDDDGEMKIIELLDNKENSHGWFGGYPYRENPNIINIEFLLEDEPDDDTELKQMESLIKYCNKHKIKFTKLDVNGDGELIYIQIPVSYVDISRIDEYNDEEDLDEGVTTSTLRQGQKFTLSADMGEFKEGDEVEVVTINKTDQDIEVTLKDTNGKTDTIYLDPNDDLNMQ